PTGGDPIPRREFWDILSDLHLQGVTLFVSTPYMDEAEHCSRIGLMFRGQIIEQGTPDAIKKLVPGQLLAVWTRDLIRARKAVAGLEGVYEVQTYGDLLHIFVDDATRRLPEIKATLRAEAIPFEQIRQTLPRMEEAFISLIRRQMEREGEST
ncbi:MAG: ABC transporter ATP-binding protein, partial [Anaerolineae bacterium]|nr:ABC transporter ATP-binding protein [Anaerolineae bacterium]